MDVLFLHVPKFSNYYKPIGPYSFVLYPPMGLFGLADYLIKNERSARIVHLAVEQAQSGRLDVRRIIEEHNPSIVGLDLHWHFQSYDVIEVARKIKLHHPNVGILLGGITASYFAEEILTDYPFVDFVIRGDAELPLLELVRQFASTQTYREVPNLAYREGSWTVLNPITFVADRALLDRLCFTDFTLMKDYPRFVSGFSRHLRVRGISETLQNLILGRQKGYPVVMGRGCQYECSFCGGSNAAHGLHGGRRQVTLRSPETVVSSLVDLERFGFDAADLVLDSFPAIEPDDLFLPVFEEVKRRGLALNLEVDSTFLPSSRFIESFRGLPGKKSFLTLSPHSQDEELRRKNRLFRYSNQALEDCLDELERQGVNFLLCFTCGLPFETREHLVEMARYQRRLRKKYSRMRLKTSMIEIEPGSDMSRHPDRYEIEPKRTRFAEYYRYHSQPRQNHWLEMGYTRRNDPDHKEVEKFFCTHFCERFKAGRASPLICSAVNTLGKTGLIQVLDAFFAGRKA